MYHFEAAVNFFQSREHIRHGDRMLCSFKTRVSLGTCSNYLPCRALANVKTFSRKFNLMLDVASFGVEIEQSALNCGFNDQSEKFSNRFMLESLALYLFKRLELIFHVAVSESRLRFA